DTMLLEEGTEFGPVVALGNPNDPVPPYGAARGYFQHADWKDGVADLAAGAQAIVICLEDSEGVWWEAEHLLAGPHARKTLFLLHRRLAGPAVNGQFVGRLVAGLPAPAADGAALLPSDRAGGGGAPPAAAVLGLFRAADGTLRIGVSSTWSRYAYLLMLR